MNRPWTHEHHLLKFGTMCFLPGCIIFSVLLARGLASRYLQLNWFGWLLGGGMVAFPFCHLLGYIGWRVPGGVAVLLHLWAAGILVFAASKAEAAERYKTVLLGAWALCHVSLALLMFRHVMRPRNSLA